MTPTFGIQLSPSTKFLHGFLMPVQIPQYEAPQIVQQDMGLTQRDGCIDICQGKFVMAEFRKSLLPDEIRHAVCGILPDNLMGKLQISVWIGAQKIEG